jgi:hypothetical protein
MVKSSGRGRIRVFFAEFEGDDETIREGLQAIGVAANKIFQSSPKTARILTAPTASGEEEELLKEFDIESEEEDLNGSTSVNLKPKSSSYKPPAMTMVKELNLRPEGKPSWRDFHAQKEPSTQEHIITIAVYYLKHTLDIEKLTPEHVFTCFKDINQRTPKNLPQAIRDIAKRKGWLDTSERGNIKITNHGENFVDHDLPTSKNSTKK